MAQCIKEDLACIQDDLNNKEIEEHDRTYDINFHIVSTGKFFLKTTADKAVAIYDTSNLKVANTAFNTRQEIYAALNSIKRSRMMVHLFNINSTNQGPEYEYLFINFKIINVEEQLSAINGAQHEVYIPWDTLLKLYEKIDIAKAFNFIPSSYIVNKSTLTEKETNSNSANEVLPVEESFKDLDVSAGNEQEAIKGLHSINSSAQSERPILPLYNFNSTTSAEEPSHLLHNVNAGNLAAAISSLHSVNEVIPVEESFKGL